MFDQFQASKIVIECFLIALSLLGREFLSDTVDDGGVELSVVSHQTSEIRVEQGDVRDIVDLLERLNSRVETLETLAKEIFDFLQTERSGSRGSRTTELTDLRCFMIEILHRLSTSVHPVDTHLVPNVAEAFRQQIQTFLLLIAQVLNDVHRVFVGVDTGEQIPIDHGGEFRDPGEFYHDRVK